MPRFKITLAHGDPEEIEADGYKDEGEWITFNRRLGEGTNADPNRNVQVLRLAAKNVVRIDAVEL